MTPKCSDADTGLVALGEVQCNQLLGGDDVGAVGPVTAIPPGAVGDATFPRTDRTSLGLKTRSMSV
jgi:hypothetical protein